MQLRKAVTLVTVLIGLTALSAAGSLIGITSYLHTLTTRIENHLESVRAAQEIEVHLLLHARNRHLARLTGEQRYEDAATHETADVFHWVATANRHVSSAEEQALVEQLRTTLEAYLSAQTDPEIAAQDAIGAYVETDALLQDARVRAEGLQEINVEQAAATVAAAEKWDSIAKWIGSSVAVLLLASVITVIGRARTDVYWPLLHLRDQMRRFSAREYSTRAMEGGVAEIRELARSFNEMATALEKHRETQLSFVAAVAHDLRNPLSAMKFAIASLPQETRGSDPQAERTIAIVARQVDSLVRMVSDLLDAARVEAGRFSIAPAACDARDLVLSTVDLFRAVAPLHEFVIKVPDSALPLTCDTVRIEQVMNNIVSNAIKYSPNGGEIVVCARREHDDVVLEVSDEGIGIADDERQRVFEPFQRGSRFGAAIPGIGLGLSVARRIVESHGGMIQIDSRPGEGSTFAVRLPAPASGARPHRLN